MIASAIVVAEFCLRQELATLPLEQLILTRPARHGLMMVQTLVAVGLVVRKVKPDRRCEEPAEERH